LLSRFGKAKSANSMRRGICKSGCTYDQMAAEPHCIANVPHAEPGCS